MFKIKLIEAINPQKPSVKRKASKAIVIQSGKLLMMQSKYGDYKFPGGGLLPNETSIDALKRECIEELGRKVLTATLIGQTFEKREDAFNPNQNYEMINYYYLTTTSEVLITQQLTDNEKKLNMQAVWVTIDEALKASFNLTHEMPWVKRERKVLETLNDIKL